MTKATTKPPKHLENRNGIWFAVLTIPVDCRKQLGKLRFVQSLKTSNEKTAKARVGFYIDKWKAEIGAARGDDQALIELTKYWRTKLNEFGAPHEHPEFENMLDMSSQVEDQFGGKKGMKFVAEASGAITPLAPLQKEWAASLVSLNLKPKTIDQMVRDVTKLTGNFKSLGLLTPRGVKAWVDLMVLEDKATNSSLNRILKSCRSFWNYLQESGTVEHIAQDPFQGMSKIVNRTVKKNTLSREDWSIDEVLLLHKTIEADGDVPLRDMFVIGAYTGCRINEICNLKLKDLNIEKKYFKVSISKTDAGVREVPIHNALIPIFTRLANGLEADDFLIPSPAKNKYDDRSAPLSKRFGYLKKDCGFTDRSKVFHSLRRTVSTLLENAGVSEGVAADIVGHKKKTMTYGLYSGGTSLENKLKALNKMKYPAPFNKFK